MGVIGVSEASLIGCRTRTVLGAKPYVQKLRYKHSVTATEAGGIQELLDNSTIITLSRQACAYQFHGVLAGRRYKLILKVVGGEQLWLSTMFRSDASTYRAAMRKGITLKE